MRICACPEPQRSLRYERCLGYEACGVYFQQHVRSPSRNLMQCPIRRRSAYVCTYRGRFVWPACPLLLANCACTLFIHVPRRFVDLCIPETQDWVITSGPGSGPSTSDADNSEFHVSQPFRCLITLDHSKNRILEFLYTENAGRYPNLVDILEVIVIE